MIAYGCQWPDHLTPLQIELSCIRLGGKWQTEGKTCGEGAFYHFMAARKLLWPDRYRHRWTELLYEEFLKNDITILMGSASCQKTSHASEFVLINYWARPKHTLVILSTITTEKLDTGVWAEVKMLWQAGRRLHPWLAGNLIESRRAIATDNIEDGEVRDLRKGIISKPCYVGGKWVGLGILAGIKQRFVFYLADELQFMAETFIGAWPNLFSNGNVKIIGSGNPKHDPNDQLGLAAEPKSGWQSQKEPEKTTCWDTKFLNGRCVNLVGTDSPNFDAPEGQPDPFPGLISPRYAKRIEHDYGKSSPQYYTQVKGVMKLSMAMERVITRQLCAEHRALEKAVWANDQHTKIYALDPTYGGDDRCVGRKLEWGLGVDGTMLLQVGDVEVCVFTATDRTPEDQVADWLEERLLAHGFPFQDARDCFYDSTGKGTLGTAFARKFGHKAPTAVDSGAQPTLRPVREGLMVEDPATKTLRPKTCREHYSKFVTEMWFAVRYCIEANQLRELPESTMVEGCARIYYMVGGNKIEVEPKSDPKRKEDLKRRLGKSPDEFDCLAIGVEGARQRGFVIGALGPVLDVAEADDWFAKEGQAYQDALKSQLLEHL